MSKKLFLFALIVGILGAAGLARNSFSAGASVQKINITIPVTDETVGNPCDPSGQSDPTVSGVATETGTIITLPDGSENGTLRLSFTGEGTDSLGNSYKCGEMVIEHEAHAQPGEGDVLVFKCKSSTGQSFLQLLRVAELRNHTIDHEKTICFQN